MICFIITKTCPGPNTKNPLMLIINISYKTFNRKLNFAFNHSALAHTKWNVVLLQTDKLQTFFQNLLHN